MHVYMHTGVLTCSRWHKHTSINAEKDIANPLLPELLRLKHVSCSPDNMCDVTYRKNAHSQSTIQSQ
jgi:hypothetical protein